MFYLLNLILPFFVLLSSLLMIISASSWFTAWVALELNMLAFLPMIISSSKLTAEAALKYFFVQVVGSIWVFFFMLYSYFYTSMFMDQLPALPFPALIFFALCLKLGAAPFHFWFPALIEGLSWNSTLILMTLQKLGPLSLIILIVPYNMILVSLFSMISAMVGGISGLNQLMCRKIMSYSSISHLGWLLCASILSKSLMWMYFSIYLIMTFMIIMLFSVQNSFHMNQIFFLQNTLISMLVLFYLNLMSMGGLPPFLGFLPKWLVVKTNIKSTMMIIVMVFSSIITLYFYLRLTYTALMFMTFKPLLNQLYINIISPLKWFILFPLITLPLMTLLI